MIYGIIFLSLTVGIALDRLYLNIKSDRAFTSMENLKEKFGTLLQKVESDVTRLRNEIHQREIQIKTGQEGIDAVVDELRRRGYGNSV